MDGQDGGGAFRHQGFGLFRVQRPVGLQDIAEDGDQALPHNGVHGGDKGEGRGYHFAALWQFQGFQHGFQGQVTVGKQRERSFQEGFQFLLQALVFHAHIGDEGTVPKVPYFGTILLERRKGRAGYIELLHWK